MPIVTRDGFKSAPLSPASVFIGAENPKSIALLTLPPDADLESIRDRLPGLRLICISFPTFSDGRGFSLARRLRRAGFKGHLRASGHLISDQFRYALDCGFDDVEISDELALRQPESDWVESYSEGTDYRARLRGIPTSAS